jgi:hypothetical protein
MNVTQPKELEMLARELGDINQRARTSLRVTLDEHGKSLSTVDVIGIVETLHQLIVSAPKRTDAGLIVVSKGQILTCHWVSPSNVFGFPATVVKVVFDPVPMLHLQLGKKISQREVRTLPRALVNLACELRTPELVPALLVDLSVGGSRIATAHGNPLTVGQSLELTATLNMLGRDFPIMLTCSVTGVLESSGRSSDTVHYYGLKFENLSDTHLLTLHGYVQTCLALESDALTQILTIIKRQQA